MRNATGMRIPIAANHAPRPVIPFFPLIMNKPVIARNSSATAKRSATHVHIFFGELRCRKFDSLMIALLVIFSCVSSPFFKLTVMVLPSTKIFIVFESGRKKLFNFPVSPAFARISVIKVEEVSMLSGIGSIFIIDFSIE